MKRIIKFGLKTTPLLLFAVTSFTVSATMYKWVDDQGNVIYSESKPSGTTAYEVVQPPAKVDSARALKELRDQKNQANKLRSERLKNEQDKQKSADEKANVAKNCELAKNKLASLQRPRARVSQPDGSRIRLNEEERQQQISQANAKIAEWCD